MRVFDREVLAVALLNTHFRLIKFEKLSLSTVNEALAHPREILKPALIPSSAPLEGLSVPPFRYDVWEARCAHPTS